MVPPGSRLSAIAALFGLAGMLPFPGLRAADQRYPDKATHLESIGPGEFQFAAVGFAVVGVVDESA